LSPLSEHTSTWLQGDMCSLFKVLSLLQKRFQTLQIL
jgi:hypothetical protein